ncbi:hypothetical protein ACJX0J_036540, partial [Zea mays]
NLATNKITLNKHVTWSLKEKIGDRYKFRISLPVIILLTVQVAINLAANKYKGILVLEQYMLEGMGQENSSVLKKVQIYGKHTFFNGAENCIVSFAGKQDRSEANELFGYLKIQQEIQKKTAMIALMFGWLPKNPVVKFKKTAMIALILLGLMQFSKANFKKKYHVVHNNKIMIISNNQEHAESNQGSKIQNINITSGSKIQNINITSWK